MSFCPLSALVCDTCAQHVLSCHSLIRLVHINTDVLDCRYITSPKLEKTGVDCFLGAAQCDEWSGIYQGPRAEPVTVLVSKRDAAQLVKVCVCACECVCVCVSMCLCVCCVRVRAHSRFSLWSICLLSHFTHSRHSLDSRHSRPFCRARFRGLPRQPAASSGSTTASGKAEPTKSRFRPTARAPDRSLNMLSAQPPWHKTVSCMRSHRAAREDWLVTTW